MITTTIKVEPPLLCCRLIAIQQRCNKPATVAHAVRLSDGSYHVQPFCEECAKGLAQVYFPKKASQSNE